MAVGVAGAREFVVLALWLTPRAHAETEKVEVYD